MASGHVVRWRSFSQLCSVDKFLLLPKYPVRLQFGQRCPLHARVAADIASRIYFPQQKRSKPKANLVLFKQGS